MAEVRSLKSGVRKAKISLEDEDKYRSIKDFRTWAGTVLTAIELAQLGQFDSAKQAQQNIVQAIKNVAKQLVNRPATCRKYYVHPAILQAYQNEVLLDLVSEITKTKSPNDELNYPEKVVLKIIKEALPVVE